MNILFVAIGGSIGAVLRSLVTRFDPLQPGQIPFGTLAVNIIGSLLFVYLYKNIDNFSFIKQYETLIFAGFLGAFTTYSTFNFQMLKLLDHGLGQFFVYMLLTLMVPLILGAILYRNL